MSGIDCGVDGLLDQDSWLNMALDGSTPKQINEAKRITGGEFFFLTKNLEYYDFQFYLLSMGKTTYRRENTNRFLNFLNFIY